MYERAVALLFVEEEFKLKNFTTNCKLNTQKGAVFMRQRLYISPCP